MVSILAVYEADNGDKFFKHDSWLKPIDDAQFKKECKEALNNYAGEIIPCKAIESNKPIEHLYYESLDGEFLGDAGVHISKAFKASNDKIYISKQGEKTKNERMFDDFTHLVADKRKAKYE